MARARVDSLRCRWRASTFVNVTGPDALVGRSILSSVMSTPVTRPSGPTSCGSSSSYSNSFAICLASRMHMTVDRGIDQVGLQVWGLNLRHSLQVKNMAGLSVKLKRKGRSGSFNLTTG